MLFICITTWSIKRASPCLGIVQYLNEDRAYIVKSEGHVLFYFFLNTCHRSIVLTWEVSTFKIWDEAKQSAFLLNAKAMVFFSFFSSYSLLKKKKKQRQFC